MNYSTSECFFKQEEQARPRLRNNIIFAPIEEFKDANRAFDFDSFTFPGGSFFR